MKCLWWNEKRLAERFNRSDVKMDRDRGVRPEVKILFQHKSTNWVRTICFKVVCCHMHTVKQSFEDILSDVRLPTTVFLQICIKMYQNVRKNLMIY